MCPNAIIIEKNKIKKASTLSIFIRIEIVYHSKSNQNEYQYICEFYLLWKWNHFIGHQLQVNIEFLKKLTFNFNLHHFCFSVLTRAI